MDVSVVFPSKNREKYVRKAVRTAFKARHVKEVIIVDGGSSDNTVEVALKEGARDEIVREIIEKSSKRSG